ncbi:MAG: multifunctional CCA tRNA nucleotidyl transferase/2'3'-cyclic phosphodiesterase/2'nucleotidase/phosphatase, partial [Comamonadaceae bacterium]|nr:multifunctional CCA tRNA nucleotidyl transferase/2'3'-cyclic phosphodiesterase/2'nucleotidase/phosphatase [Comamonadaceae bacterium]
PQSAEYHPEVDTGVHLMMVLDMSARLGASLPVRFACLCHDLGKGSTPADVLPRHIGHEERSARLLKGVCERWRVPRECRELADVVAREHGNLHRSHSLSPTAVLRLLERCDALRRPERFTEVLLACECDARGRLGFEESGYPQRERLLRALDAAVAVDPQPLAAQISASLPADASAQARAQLGPRIARTIHAARAQAVAAALNAVASPTSSG